MDHVKNLRRRVSGTVLVALLAVGQLVMGGEPGDFPAKTPSGNKSDFKLKTALHSVSYAGFWRGQAQLSVDEFLLKAKELGFDGVVLVAKRPHLSLLDYDDAGRKKLRARLSELGLELVALAGYTDFTAGLDRPGIPHTEIQAEYVGQLARMARDLGTNIVRIFTGYERSSVPYDRQYATVVEGLRLAGREAAKYGVTLAVQNHHDIGLHHEEMYWLLKEVNMPNVRAGWDAWSPTLEGLDPQGLRQSILKMKPYIVHTIAADYVRVPRFQYKHELTNYSAGESLMRAVPMGQGIIDYNTFIGTLKEIGYQGYITYEMCEVLDGGGSVENLDKTARKFLDFVQRFK
jgi:sugar phosphate isomerase/epimerase